MAERNSQKAQLIRGIGAGGVALIVLNSMIGSGIFALPATVNENAGALGPWLFLACGVLITAIVLTYSELASYFRESGGPVLYTSAALGPLAGFCAGWFLYLSRMTAFAANCTVMALYLGTVWPWFGEGLGRAAMILAVCCALTWVNYLGVKDGIRAIGALTFFKVGPLILLVLIGLPYVSSAILWPSPLPRVDDPGGTMLLLIYAFVGFEAGTITAGETSRPRHTLPRVLVATVAATGVLYFLISLVYVAALPSVEGNDTTLVAIGGVLAGSAGIVAITAAAIFSIGGNLASNMLTVPRLTYALAKEGMLPQWFATVHPRYATPSNSIVFLGALTLIFALSGSFAWLAAASSLSRLIVYILCICSLPVIRRRADSQARTHAFRLPGGYLIPALALVLCLWIALQSTASSWQVTAGLAVSGLLLFALERRRLQRANRRSTGRQ